MAIDIKPILGIGLAGQSMALANQNLKLVKKKKIKPKDLIKAGTTNIVGVNLIKAQAEIIGGL